ncbi:MAG: hypothetical protein II997_03080 [Clostridia bacterium]|nr:hypothetical protein [Clostridia bacterium]
MYTLFDDFRSCDENKQPYSFSVERHTPVANLHTWVKEDAFYMASVGNRYILQTPNFTNGTFVMHYRATYMAEFATNFMVLFGYDERTRSGQAIRYIYDLGKTITLSLLSVHKNAFEVLEEAKLTIEAPLEENKSYLFSVAMENGSVSVSLAGAEATFKTDLKPGKLAIERANFIGELIIDDISFTSPDVFNMNNVIPETTVSIPCINGGDIPYRLTWKIDTVEGEYYLTATLDGGCKTRVVDREDRPGQYVAEKDWMTNPYIGLGNKTEKPKIYYLAQGRKAFIDPNIYWDCQKDFFFDTELPLTNTYHIPAELITDNTELVFGYDNLRCTGYLSQEGGCEFHFTPEGELTYTGDAVNGEDIFELYSPADKAVLSLVPEECYEREQVIEHLIYNHYFTVEENIHFNFVMKTLTDTEYLTVTANILDVYESETLGSYTTRISVTDWDYGYHQLQADFTAPKMEIGVYKVEFCVHFGGKLYKRFVKVFEVFDVNSKVNPALASGLPFTFHMPNEQKRLMRNAFDLWNPLKSCDTEHYYNCITDTPEEAQTRKSWSLSKPFKREWFVWISSRTCKDWNINRFTDVVENCDYMFSSINEEVLDLSQSTLFPMRQDHNNYPNFMMRAEQRIAILDKFLTENPQIAEKVLYKVGMKEFTYEHFLNLLQVCGDDWITYQNEEGLRLVRQNNEAIKKINPAVKRSLYGPINVYTTPTLTNRSLKIIGFNDCKTLAKDFFTGFTVFEDYPYSCSYQTYRGAFTMRSILLHAPDLVMYPEQYSGSPGGCIDGAVKFAHAPMGAYSVEPYQLSTHAFEYVFNTAYRLRDGYHYWDTYGFHRAPGLLSGMVCDWKNVIDYKPERPLPSTAFLAEYDSREDVVEISPYNENDSKCYIMNQSESAHGLLFECTREAGIPNGFALNYEGLSTLSAEECDVLVLPCLAYAEKEVIQEIRRLYNEGVNLIAVSDVTGLEDIFGVLSDKKQITLNCISYRDKQEFVRESEAWLGYKSDGAEVIMQAETGEPLIMMNERTAIINTAVTNLGCADSQYMSIANALHIVGDLVFAALKDVMRKLSKPLAVGENVGVTLFKSEKGQTILLAMDYTPFDNREHDAKEAVIRLNMDNVTDVSCKMDVFVGKKGSKVRELRFDIRPHESVFVELLFD